VGISTDDGKMRKLYGAVTLKQTISKLDKPGVKLWHEAKGAMTLLSELKQVVPRS